MSKLSFTSGVFLTVFLIFSLTVVVTQIDFKKEVSINNDNICNQDFSYLKEKGIYPGEFDNTMKKLIIEEDLAYKCNRIWAEL